LVEMVRRTPHTFSIHKKSICMEVVNGLKP